MSTIQDKVTCNSALQMFQVQLYLQMSLYIHNGTVGLTVLQQSVMPSSHKSCESITNNKLSHKINLNPAVNTQSKRDPTSFLVFTSRYRY